MLFKKKRYEIHYQIEEFLAYRKRRVGTDKNHGYHLKQFAKITGVTRAEDISEYDIRAYVEALNDKGGSGFVEAQTAFRLFYGFVKQKEYLSQFTHNTHNWDIVRKDRFQESFVIPLPDQIKNDMIEWSMKMQKRRPGQPAKEDRNKEIAKLFKEDQKRKTKKWSYRKLGEKYEIHWTRIPEILEQQGILVGKGLSPTRVDQSIE